MQWLKGLVLLTVPRGLSRGPPHATECQREPRRGTWSCELLRAGGNCSPGNKGERQAPKFEGKQIHGRFVPKRTKASLETILYWLITRLQWVASENHHLGTSVLLQMGKRQPGWPQILWVGEGAGIVTGETFQVWRYSWIPPFSGNQAAEGAATRALTAHPALRLPSTRRALEEEMQLMAPLGFLGPFSEEKPHFRHFRVPWR